MDEAKRRLVLGWLAKAEDDLRVARLLADVITALMALSYPKDILALTPARSGSGGVPCRRIPARLDVGAWPDTSMLP